MRRHRARDLEIPGVFNRQQLIEWLKKRDGNDCKICGYPIVMANGRWGYSIDHMLPLSKGGLHTASNVQLTHKICNNHKGNGSNESITSMGTP
jgi:5-methylcytosine-specific restriction endonuclease McrA